MFEALNRETLDELAKVGDRSLFKSTTRCDDLIACLEQGIVECRLSARSSETSGFDMQQVASGLQAAQQILAGWWSSTEPNSAR